MLPIAGKPIASPTIDTAAEAGASRIILVAAVVWFATRARTQAVKNEPQRDRHDPVRALQLAVNLFTTPPQRV